MRAPHDGILVLTRNWRGEVPRVGQSVWRGEPIGEIPDLAAMKADVFVLEADAGGLAVGAKAMLTVESHPEKEIPATVTRVDGLARPRQRGNPVQYFGATVELSATDPSFMKPGQRVQARIVLDERDGVLSVPRQAVVEEKGKKLVFRRKRGRFEPVEVETGAFAPGRVEIRKGIAAGDEVALVDPRRLGDGAGTGAAAPTPPLPTAKGGAK